MKDGQLGPDWDQRVRRPKPHRALGRWRNQPRRVRYRRMATIQILVRVKESFGTDVPDPPGQGHRFIFSDDLVLERYDDSTPGIGLPLDPDERRAGTQSGFQTLVRVAATGDLFFRLAANSGTTRARTVSTPWTTLLCRRARSPHEAWPSLMARTSWTHPFGLRSLVGRAPVPPRTEQSPRGFQRVTTGCLLSSSDLPAFVAESSCAGGVTPYLSVSISPSDALLRAASPSGAPRNRGDPIGKNGRARSNSCCGLTWFTDRPTRACKQGVP